MAYDRQTARELVARSGRKLLDTGLIVRTWGNISARISEDEFAITPSGRGYESLEVRDIVTVNMKDLSYDGDVKPSSEKALHAVVYRRRPDIHFIIHTHQRYASALSVLGYVFPVAKIDPEAVAVLGEEVPTAHYALSSTKALASQVDKVLNDFPFCRAILLNGHGAVCLGVNDTSAFSEAHALEEMASIRYRAIVKGLLPRECYHEYQDSDYYHICRREINDEFDEHYVIFDDPKINCVIETATPFVKKMSERGRGMKVCLDDLAQMTGTRVPCFAPGTDEKKIRPYLRAPGGAVLIEGRGGLCAGASVSDAEAMCLVLEKNAMAALLGETGRYVHTVNPLLGRLEHSFYVNKYSKLK